MSLNIDIEFDKSDNFKSLKKVFELTGHNSRVFSSDISPDSSKMLTVSNDATWRLYNTDGAMSPFLAKKNLILRYKLSRKVIFIKLA